MSIRWRQLGEKLVHLDRRWLYLSLAVAILVSLLTGLQFPDQPSALVWPVYTKIEELPAGSPVLVSLEYTPSTLPELEPMAFAITRHALLKGHRLCFLSLWPEGNNLIGRVVEQVISQEFPTARAGQDWVVLGYKAGNEMLINALRQSISSMYTTDVGGTPLAQLPALTGVEKLSDFALIVALSAGTPGLKEWILYAGDPEGIPVVGGCNGTGAPQFMPYFPQQLLGLLGGLKGAAEYETALQQGYPGFPQRTRPATERMGPQAVAHAVIIIFILLGNLGFLLARRRGGDGL
jgi:hypothetical protein